MRVLCIHELWQCSWYDTASPYVWEYRGAPKRFSFRVAYRGTRERDEGTLSPEETVSVGG